MQTGAHLGRLSSRFPLITRAVSVGGREWQITAVEDQDRLLESVKTDRDLESFPYGLLLWASAIGLARWLAESPHVVRGKRVLEIGCGVGLPGLVARWLGADVEQSDYLEAALVLAEHNAAENGIVGIRQFVGDWRSFPSLPAYDVIIGSDVLYERSLHDSLAILMERALCPGGLVILSDPMRPMALEFVDRLERQDWRIHMDCQVVEWDSDPREIAVFRLSRGGNGEADRLPES